MALLDPAAGWELLTLTSWGTRTCQGSSVVPAPWLSPTARGNFSFFPSTPGKPQADPAREEAWRRKEAFTHRRVSDEVQTEVNTFFPRPSPGRPASSAQATPTDRLGAQAVGATMAQINKHIRGHVGSLTCLVACQVPSWASEPASHPGRSPGANTNTAPLGAGGTSSGHGTGDRGRKTSHGASSPSGEVQRSSI